MVLEAIASNGIIIKGGLHDPSGVTLETSCSGPSDQYACKNVHIEFDPGMVGKAVLVCHMT